MSHEELQIAAAVVHERQTILGFCRKHNDQAFKMRERLGADVDPMLAARLDGAADGVSMIADQIEAMGPATAIAEITQLREKIEQMEDRIACAVQECDDVLKGLVAAPRMWGTPLAQEVLMFLACEIKATLTERVHSWNRIQEEWIAFAAQKLPGTPSNVAVSARCEQEVLTTLIREFIAGPFQRILSMEPADTEEERGPCDCICHQMPNVKHVAPCCEFPPMEEDENLGTS